MDINATNTMTETTIPQPKEKLLIGNLLELSAGRHVQDLMKLTREYGPIYRLSLPGHSMVAVYGAREPPPYRREALNPQESPVQSRHRVHELSR